MSGPLDGLIILQWVGVVLPTIAVTALFVRLGSLLKTIQRLEADVARVSLILDSLTVVALELKAWRDASKEGQADLLARVRRLEDRPQA